MAALSFSLSPLLLLLLSSSILLQILTDSSSSTSAASDVDLLLTTIKTSLKGSSSDNLLLDSWNSSSPLCQWRGLSWIHANGTPLNCHDISSFSSPRSTPSVHLLSLQLPSANLTGTLPKEIGEFSMLQSIYIGLNSLSGGVPLELGYSSSLSAVDLNGNNLTGDLPPSIWNLCDDLISLNFNGNYLSGAVTKPALPNNSCEKLVLLDLGSNRFSGNFPEFFLEFRNLNELDLSGNLFNGQIPERITDLKNLEKLNLSKNNFSGVLPRTEYGAGVFEGNDASLCGRPLRRCRSGSRLSSGAVAVILIAVMSGGVVTASVLIGYSQRRRRGGKGGGLEGGDDDDDDGDGCSGGVEGKLVLFEGGEHFTLEEVLNATGQVMEKTFYGTVYKAKLADGGSITLRLLREGTCKDSSSCLRVIKLLGRIRHDNLVPLRAFYQGKKGEKLLICDYLPHKSLHCILHETKGGRSTLNWGRRHKIALCVGKALAHLHTGLDVPVTHGNVGSKNVLVDDFFVARLSEFGIDRLMAGAAGREMVAAAREDGRKAPELGKTNRCSGRTDVYGFGILLLELLTGRRPGAEGEELPSVVKLAVLEETTSEVFDPEVVKGVRGAVDEGLVQTLRLAMGCCAPVPSLRPTMGEAVRLLEESRPRNRSALYSPAEPWSGVATPF